MLVEAACRLDPPRLRRVLGHLQAVADPEGADRDTQRRQQRRGLWLTPTWDGMVAIDGLLEPEAGQTLIAALEPLARPADAQDARSGGQRTRRCPHRTGPPQPGGRPAAPDRWGPPPADRDRGPGQPPRPPCAVWVGEVGWGRDPWTPRPVGGWPVTAR